MANNIIEIDCQEPTQKPNGTKTPPKSLPNQQPTPMRRNPRRATRSNNPLDKDPPNLPTIIPLSDDDVASVTDCKIKDSWYIIVQVPIKILSAPFNQTTKLNSDDPAAILEVRYEEPSCYLTIAMGVEEENTYGVTGRVIWVAEETENKVLKQVYKKLGREPTQIVKHRHKDGISDVFVVLTVELKKEESALYKGLVNKGSTCYMNSFLQMINHIPALRNLVYKMKDTDPDKFPGTFQTLLYKLSLTDEKSVSTDSLIKSYGWTKEENFVQQDVQEFSCLFFEVLERKIDQQPELKGSINRLMEGQLTNYIQCIDVKYRSEFTEKFIELQVQVSGYNNLQDSLTNYLNYEVLEGDNRYRTEQFGLQVAKKGVKISAVGPVLMIQLKRFQFNFQTQINEKVLDRFEYPDVLPLGSILNIPSLPQYRLYGVLVHTGQRANSGHYYTYLKIGMKWYKFNDEKVTEATRKEVFEYNFGGEKTTRFVLDQKQLVLQETEEINGSTAYMLVYYNEKLRHEIFNQGFEVPAWIRERAEKKKEEMKDIQCQTISVRVIRWENIKDQPVNGKGLVRPEDWEKYPQMQFQSICSKQAFMDMFTGHSKHTYLYFLENSKTGSQILVQLCQKKGKTVGELFKKSDHPAIMIFQGSLLVQPLPPTQTFPLCVVIKLFRVNSQSQITFQFSEYMMMSKDSKSDQLLKTLNSIYPEQNYTCNYYDEREDGKPMLFDFVRFLIPKPKSRQVPVIVEKIHKNAKGVSYEKYAKEKGKDVEVILRSEDGKVEEVCALPRDMSIIRLTKYIFEKLLGKSEEYISHDHITIKIKTTKGSKRYTEMVGGIVQNFIKISNTILFGFSKMDSKQRQNSCSVVEFRYRYRSLLLSEPLEIIISKEQKKNIYEQMGKNNRISECLELEKADAFRVLILDAQMTKIIQLYEQENEDITQTWKKQKGSSIIIQAKDVLEIPSYSVLCHHKTKNGEFIGSPFVIQIGKTQSMAVLANTALNLSKQQTYIFDGKNHTLNAAKTTMTLYRVQQSASMGIQLNYEVTTPVEQMYPQDDYLFLDINHNYLTRVYKTMKIDV